MKRAQRISTMDDRRDYHRRYNALKRIKGMYWPFAEATYEDESKMIDTTQADYRECAKVIDALFDRMEKRGRMAWAVKEVRRRTQQGDVS